MNIKIETYGDYKYEPIYKEYGSVLDKFGLTKADDETAYVNINGLEDLLDMDKKLRDFDAEREDYSIYFGIIIGHDEDENPLLVLKDNYD